MYGIIYKATNKVNGKCYIGQTIMPLNKRIHIHINSSLNRLDNMYFHKAIRKYGKESFEWEVVAECYSKKELNSIEIWMIEKYNTFNKGYNLALGGNSNAGYKYTKEQKRKNSEMKKGKKHTEETKKKMSEAQKGEKNSMYGKCGKDSPNFGKIQFEETKKKISETLKGEKNFWYGKRGNKNPTAKKYTVTTPEGKEIFVHGIIEFCRNYKKDKLNYLCLIRVAQGKHKQHKGYKCRYMGVSWNLLRR